MTTEKEKCDGVIMKRRLHPDPDKTQYTDGEETAEEVDQEEDEND